MVAAIAIGITFQAQSYLRYIFPSFVMLAAVLGIFISDMSSASLFGRNFVFAAIGMIVALNFLFLNAGAFYGDFPLGSLIGESSRKDFLEEAVADQECG